MSTTQENTQGNLQDAAHDATNRTEQGFENAHQREEETVGKAKDSFKRAVSDKLPVPTPPAGVFQNQATAHELKSRLNWGEPGLTILDVRDRTDFDHCRILGAVNTPLDTLPHVLQDTIQPSRDLYVYGNSDTEAAFAASTLRQAGFQHVAELQGGLDSWKQIEGSIDGTETNGEPSPGAYNVVSRLKEFAEEKATEQKLK